MTESVRPVKRSERVDRLLDAASELLVRWGYQRVTIEDVARQAGIGKGTVYLHFPTKDALFLAVVLRCHQDVLRGMGERMAADPAEALPARASATLYRRLAADPVLRPLYLSDPEILGRLAHAAADSLGELQQRRTEAGREWFTLLRGAGLLRTDLTVDEQMRVFSAVTTGFFFLDTLPALPGPEPPDRRADLLEHTLAAALQIPGARPDAATAHRCAAVFRSLLDTIAVDTDTR